MGLHPDKMGKVYPDIVEPDPLADNPPTSCIDVKHRRKPTDVCFFTFFALFFVVLFFLTGYCIYFGDIRRVMNGYDHCGNICGQNKSNPVLDVNKCKETDFGRYHAVIRKNGFAKRMCTNDCTKLGNYVPFLNRCLPDTKTGQTLSLTELKYYLVEVFEDLQIYWQSLLHLCVLSLALSVLIVLLFRFCVGFIVWILLIGVELACLGASIALWVLFAQCYQDGDEHSENTKWMRLGFAVGATVLTIVVGLIIFCIRKKIDLVVQLFEEAGKAIADMPGLLFQPLWTFVAFAVMISCSIYLCLWIVSAGHLEPRRENDWYYKKDGWMNAAGVLSVVGMLWMIQFIIGCQHMIVAGAVSKWYFTRDKSYLSSPVTESAYNLTRYHLGSVALGSFIVTLIKILRIIVSILQKALSQKHENSCLICLIRCSLWFCNCFLECLDWIVHTFSTNAYIVVAMYGHSFFKAGKQAFVRIAAHPLSFATINSVGDFLLFLGKVIVVVVAEAASLYWLKDKGIHHLWVFQVLVGLFSLSISHLFITLYEMTIDTIFICFCEDSEMNDGVSKPYYMSRGLMEFVENSKIAEARREEKKLRKTKQLEGNELETVSLDVEKKDNQTV